MGKSQSDLVGVLTGDRWLQEVWHISSELAYLWVLPILPFLFVSLSIPEIGYARNVIQRP